MHRGETPVGAGTLPRPRGGPAMAARSLPTSAQVSFWFKDKQTARVSCGHPLWTVQPPTASAVLGTTTLSPAPPDDPGASSPVPWSRRTDAVSHGPLLQSPLHSALCLVRCRESGRPSRRSLAPWKGSGRRRPPGSLDKCPQVDSRPRKGWPGGGCEPQPALPVTTQLVEILQNQWCSACLLPNTPDAKQEAKRPRECQGQVPPRTLT